MRQLLTVLVVATAMFTFGGCCAKKSHVVKQAETKSSLYKAAVKVADEILTCPVLKANKSTPIVLTTMVSVHNFNETSDFGRLYSETLLSEISKRGFTVIDYRGQRIISQTQDGEFALIREEKKNSDFANGLILVGTYAPYNSGLALNTRLLDANNQIQSSSNVQISDKELTALAKKNRCDLLGCPEPKKVVKVEPPFIVPIKEDDCDKPGKCCNGPECKTN